MVLSMDRWRGKVAVVTGASGAIAGVMIEQLVEKGLQVVGIDNRSENFETLSKKIQKKKGSLHTFTVDITSDEEVVKVFNWSSANLGPVHILINCAALVQQTNLIEGDTEKWRKVLDTNVLGLCITTREAVKIMRDNKIDGHIVHIGSIAGYAVPNVPEMNVYPASKFAVRALTETLRQELNRLGLKIKITCVSPGKVTSLMAENNGFVLGEKMIEMINRMPKVEPGDIVDGIMYALSTPPHVQVHDLCIKPVGEMY